MSRGGCAPLSLRADELARWPTLSPGERKRWQVGAALAARPDVLILDEPTNHLDAEARAVLVAVLERFSGIGVLVSHDRELLDALDARDRAPRARARDAVPRRLFGRARDLASRRGGPARRAREPARRHARARAAHRSTLDDYYWGHNSNLMEKAHILAVAARLAPERGWLAEAARDQWHWVLGRNPIGSSMVTGVGRGPTRIYHLEWGTREPPPPGFLIGGPNARDMGFLSPEAPAKALLWDNPRPLRSGLPPHSLWHWRQSDLWDGGFVPEGSYDVGWWTVNEPDILYSANLVLAGATLPR